MELGVKQPKASNELAMWQNIISACQSLSRWNAKEDEHSARRERFFGGKVLVPQGQEALSMLRLILLIIYIYSCRHEGDFEKSLKPVVTIWWKSLCGCCFYCCYWRAGTCWFYPCRFGHLGAAAVCAAISAAAASPFDCLPLIAADVLQLCRRRLYRHRLPQIKLLPDCQHLHAGQLADFDVLMIRFARLIFPGCRFCC